MKSISQINNELEQINIKLKDISEELSAIDKAAKNVDIGIDLEKVMTSSKAELFKDHSLREYNKETIKSYLLILFSLTYYYSSNVFDEMVYLYKIALSAGYVGDPKEIHANALKLTEQQLDASVSAVRNAKNDAGELRELLGVEMLIIARKYTDNKEQVFKYLARIFALLGFDNKRVSFMTEMSELILTQKIIPLKNTPYDFLPEQYYCYISKCDNIMKYINDTRKTVYLKHPHLFAKDMDGRSKYPYIFKHIKTTVINGMVYISYLGYIHLYYNDNISSFNRGGFQLITERIKPNGLFCYLADNDSINVNFVKIGCFHSPYDFKYHLTNWYKKQPYLDPQHGNSISDRDRTQIYKQYIKNKELYCNDISIRCIIFRGDFNYYWGNEEFRNQCFETALAEHNNLMYRIKNGEDQ